MKSIMSVSPFECESTERLLFCLVHNITKAFLFNLVCVLIFILPVLLVVSCQSLGGWGGGGGGGVAPAQFRAFLERKLLQ